RSAKAARPRLSRRSARHRSSPECWPPGCRPPTYRVIDSPVKLQCVSLAAKAKPARPGRGRTGKENAMRGVTRRSLIRSSAGLVAAGALAHPYVANAAAATATVWWTQGFAQEEDIAFKKVVADYEKACGNKIDLSITPFAPQRQKIVAAMQSGIVPDLFPNNPGECIALYAWDDRLVDVTDVVETQREEYTETALLNVNCYNSVEKKRHFYGVPLTVDVLPNHVWRPLV